MSTKSAQLLATALALAGPHALHDLYRDAPVLTEAERDWFLSHDRGGRDIWKRRFANGLSASERAYVDQQLLERKTS